MAVKFALFPNPLTPDTGDYTAVVQSNDTLDLKDIARFIHLADNTVGEVDALAVLRGMERICEELLIQGNRVILGDLVQLFPRVKGKFESPVDEFDPTRHRIDVGANPGQRVRNSVRENAGVEKVRAIKPRPELLMFTDIGTGEPNAPLTPGGPGLLQGSRLKFDPDVPDEGIFFVPNDGGPETKVTLISEIRPAQIHFQVPALAPGDYTLEVRAHIVGGTELRVGQLDPTLTVS